MKKRFFPILSIVIFFWFAGFLVFAYHINHYLLDAQTNTDAIIALTGGRNRIFEAIKLLNNKKADYLFISGVEKTSRLQDILNSNHITPITEKKIFLGTSAQNTVENAVESKNWINEHNIKSIRLVTSNYHLPRSITEFEKQNPGLKIVKHPVYSEKVKKKWWTSIRTFSLIFSEYNKFLFTWLRTKFQTEKN